MCASHGCYTIIRFGIDHALSLSYSCSRSLTLNLNVYRLYEYILNDHRRRGPLWCVLRRRCERQRGVATMAVKIPYIRVPDANTHTIHTHFCPSSATPFALHFVRGQNISFNVPNNTDTHTHTLFALWPHLVYCLTAHI